MKFAFKSLEYSQSAIFRKLSGRKTVVVYINLGVSRTINIADFLQDSEIPPNVRAKVLVVTNDSRYRIGDFISNPRRFELARFDAIAMELEDGSLFTTTTTARPTTDGGSTVTASFILIASAAVLLRIQ